MADLATNLGLQRTTQNVATETKYTIIVPSAVSR